MRQQERSNVLAEAYRSFRKSTVGDVADGILPIFPMPPMPKDGYRAPDVFNAYMTDIDRSSVAHLIGGAVESFAGAGVLLAVAILMPPLATPVAIGVGALTAVRAARVFTNMIRENYHDRKMKRFSASSRR